jgi:hypothetical protein
MLSATLDVEDIELVTIRQTLKIPVDNPKNRYTGILPDRLGYTRRSGSIFE